MVLKTQMPKLKKGIEGNHIKKIESLDDFQLPPIYLVTDKSRDLICWIFATPRFSSLLFSRFSLSLFFFFYLSFSHSPSSSTISPPMIRRLNTVYISSYPLSSLSLSSEDSRTSTSGFRTKHVNHIISVSIYIPITDSNMRKWEEMR